MKALALLAFVALGLQEPEIDLDRERLAMRDGSGLAMVTLIATYPDGTPVRGEIQCGGNWHKHQDGNPEQYGPSLPFVTDSRGAVIMNPHLSDEWIVCWSAKDGATGKVIVSFDERTPRSVHRIVLRKDS